MSDTVFDAYDRNRDKAEERQALHDMPGLLPLLEAIDFYHVIVTGRGFRPYKGMFIRAITLPRPLDFVHVIEVWHCEGGRLQYANAYGENYFAAYRKVLEHIRQQAHSVFIP